MAIPFIFMVGDSISMQYGPYLSQYLDGKALYARKGDFEKSAEFDANGGDSQAVVAYIQSLIQARNFLADILLVNCGLHDIRRNLEHGNFQIGPDQYRRNLQQLLNDFPLFASKMVWINTTPVAEAIHNARTAEFRRYDADVENFNHIAQEVLSPAGIETIDLNGFTRHLGNAEELYEDHVHFRDVVRRLQAAYIAGCLAHLM